MGELLAVICDSCGEPMVPNVSTLDDDGCGWICLSPGCSLPESARPAAPSSTTHMDRHSGAAGRQAAWCSHASNTSGQELANLLI